MRKLAFLALKHRHLLDLAVFLIALPAYYWSPAAQAASFINRSLQLGSMTPSVSTTYQLTLTVNDSSSIGSLAITLCSNNPLSYDVCNIPTGLDASSATLSSQSGTNDFTILSRSPNSILLTRPPGAITPPVTLQFTFSNIINPSNFGPYFGRVGTYASTDGSGSLVDFGGVAFYINGSLQITTKVPPFLTFCSGVSIANFDCSQASGSYLNFGEFSPTHASAASSQMLAATNAASGYTIQMAGTTLVSGNNIIDALGVPANSRPGTSQFGLNLRANNSPQVGSDPTGLGSGMPTSTYSQPNLYIFQPNGTIVVNGQPDNYRQYTVSYVVNVSKDQPAGLYVSTLTYVATPNF